VPEIDPAWDFGGPELDAELAELARRQPPALPVLPARPPAPPRANVEPAELPPEVIERVGPPPEGDPLAMQSWLHRMIIASAAWTATDTKISSKDRRRELRTIAAAAAKLLPHSRLYEAEQLIKRDRLELERRRRDRAGAKLVARPVAAGGAKVIPIRPPPDIDVVEPDE